MNGRLARLCRQAGVRPRAAGRALHGASHKERARIRAQLEDLARKRAAAIEAAKKSTRRPLPPGASSPAR